MEELSQEQSYEKFVADFYKRAKSYNSEEGGEKVVMDSRETTMPVHHIKWGLLGIVAYLLSLDADEHSEYILDRLLEKKKNVNYTKDAVPPLTALAQHSRSADPVLMRQRAIKLLKEGANPNFISRRSCISKFTVPDALGLAANNGCVPLMQELLAYWWPAPVYMLDNWTGQTPGFFKLLFPIVTRYGWPHGKKVCGYVEYFIESVIERNMDPADAQTWSSFSRQMRSGPSALQLLCRINIRQIVGQNCSSGHEFYNRISSIENLPKNLRDYLLYK
ncbi:Hypothetical predicted protein [Cloeon dipterum]|uniref:SOCS box domain-containing protein n=1 Tax=Cloeon dipterum TaxID=197152 RepID=A0A8S1C602_9INSE|nr:Hypothetical predicted protein [Cloeon dipterum]